MPVTHDSMRLIEQAKTICEQRIYLDEAKELYSLISSKWLHVSCFFGPNMKNDLLFIWGGRSEASGAEFRPKLFEFSCAFLNSDICKFWDLFAAQFTFSEMFLFAFDEILPTFGLFLTFLSHFHKMRQLFWFEKQLAASQFIRILLAHRSAATK